MNVLSRFPASPDGPAAGAAPAPRTARPRRASGRPLPAGRRPDRHAVRRADTLPASAHPAPPPRACGCPRTTPAPDEAPRTGRRPGRAGGGHDGSGTVT